jgi:hypothetical protein
MGKNILKEATGFTMDADAPVAYYEVTQRYNAKCRTVNLINAESPNLIS